LPGSDAKAKESSRVKGEHVKYSIDLMRLYVKFLNPITTEDTLMQYFSKFGKVEDISLPKNKANDKNNRTYAFITFSSYKKFPLNLEHIIDGR
jgi:RNA-binding protein Musashi